MGWVTVGVGHHFGRPASLILVDEGFPKKSSCSQENMQIILKPSFISTFVYIKEVLKSYYFLYRLTMGPLLDLHVN